MYFATVLLFCLQLLSSQTTNRSETQFTVGSISSQKENVIESETTEAAVKPYRSPTTVATVSKTEGGDADNEHQSSSLNPEKISMVIEKKRKPTNRGMTELATTVPDLLISATVLTKPHDHDSTTRAVSITTGPIPESSSGLVTKQTSIDFKLNNIWYVSDDGSDDSDCHFIPCRNLQTVLDRATDGADIYVTSDTLSLDGNRNKFNDCPINSPLSYTISPLGNNKVTVQCTEYIDWIVSDSQLVKERGLPTVTLNQIHFKSSRLIFFQLYGLVTLNHCSFSVYLTFMLIRRSQYEPAPTEENVRSFQSYVANKSIRLNKSELLVGVVVIRVYDAARKVSIIECGISHLNINMGGEEDDALSLLFLHICGSFSGAKLTFVRTKENSFIFINLVNSNMSDVTVKSLSESKGKIGLNIENVTWVNNNDGFMELDNVVSVSLVSSQLLLNCDECSPIIIRSLNIEKHSLEYYFRNEITHELFLYWGINEMDSGIFFMIWTTLEIHVSPQDSIATTNAIIILINNRIIIERSISFRAQQHFEITNCSIQCPKGQLIRRIATRKHIIYECNPTCDGKTKYSLESGSFTVSEETKMELFTLDSTSYSLTDLKIINLLLISYDPPCFPCPLGAKCEDSIQALPDYWGYTVDNQSVSMVRCPDGYCCQGNDTCGEINSCNTGRTGTLCGTCNQGLTESLFTPKCWPTESCRSGLVAVILITAVIIYSVALLSFSSIKDKLIKILKKGYTICKSKFQQDKPKQSSTNEHPSEEDTKTDEGGTKYMQLLFYYVQDSEMFTVHLPEIGVNTENSFVEFLEFSPLILEAYVQATELCFSFSTAIIKVVLEFSFGFLVMAFLFLVYLIQYALSHLVQRKSVFGELQIKLVQAFLLTILFSYQKVVMGAFTLVQCVVIRGKAMMFVQADIQCYTWWQIGIVIFLFTCIVPMFFVIAHVPFCVKERRMSVQNFILSCLFPLPVMLVYYLKQYRNRKCNTTGPSAKSDIETLEMVEIQYPEDSVGETPEKVSLTSKDLNGSENLQRTDTKLTQVEIKERINVAIQLPETSYSLTTLTNNCEELANKPKDESSMKTKTKLLQMQDRKILTAPAADIDTDKIVNEKDICRQKRIGKDTIDKAEGLKRTTDEQKNGKPLDENEVDKTNSCEEMIEESLLKHYKCLSLFGIRFTWLGVHKIYRVALVACKAFITEPITRLYVMSVIVMMMTGFNALIRPYKEQTANKTATMSYIASLCIAGMNLVKAHLVAYGCDTSCDHRDTVIRYMGRVEDVLLLYVPIVALILWVLQTGLQKCLKKCKKQKI